MEPTEPLRVGYGAMPAPKVYLSSTLKDLEPEREAIRDVLGSYVAVSHSYRSGEQDLIAHCLSDVADCDIFVLVLGMRYGHVPDAGFGNPKGLSITELEYEHALQSAVPHVLPSAVTLHSSREAPAWRIRIHYLER